MKNEAIIQHQLELNSDGYTVIPDVFPESAIGEMIAVIDNVDHTMFLLNPFILISPGNPTGL